MLTDALVQQQVELNAIIRKVHNLNDYQSVNLELGGLGGTTSGSISSKIHVHRIQLDSGHTANVTVSVIRRKQCHACG